MNRIAAAFVASVTALSLAPSPAYAQNPNSTASRLAALEAKVAKLEGQIVAADLIGEYRVAGFLVDPDAPDANNPPQIAFAVAYGTVTLLDGGVALINGTFQGTEFVLSNPVQAVPVFQQENNNPATWTYADGTLTLTTAEPGDAPLVLNVAAGGRLMTSAAIGDDGDHDLIILTRLR